MMPVSSGKCFSCAFRSTNESEQNADDAEDILRRGGESMGIADRAALGYYTTPVVKRTLGSVVSYR